MIFCSRQKILGSSHFLTALLIALSFFSCLHPTLSLSIEGDEQHVHPPRHIKHNYTRSDMTLRDFLLEPTGFHLAMAPAFFGYYGYFGVLSSWEDVLGPSILTKDAIKSVAGASAGAIAAVLLAAGVSPQHAVEMCRSLTLDQISDFPGFGAVFRGHRIQDLMHQFLEQKCPDESLLLEDSKIPVAVTGFDLSSMSGKVLSTGSMARAARASATFPFLFQPVSWTYNDTDYMLIDGGLADVAGLAGLSAFIDDQDDRTRVVNLQIGSFFGPPPGPSAIPGKNSTLLSISITGLPQCGPWALDKGPIAVDAAQRAMTASLNTPLFYGREDRHYELHLDASKFWKET